MGPIGSSFSDASVQPNCLQCEKPLRPVYDYSYSTVIVPGGFMQRRVQGPLRGYGYLSNGKFCTLRCGFTWAVANAPTPPTNPKDGV